MNTDVVSLDTALREVRLANAVNAITERPHHPFSPSKLQYLEVSPNYTSRQSDSVASQRGTAQHDAAEEHVDLDDPTLEDHEAEAVAMCKNYREQLISKYPGGTVVKEIYLPIDDKKIFFGGVWHDGTTAGYIDLGVISSCETIAEIADWKFGLWSVEPANNNLQGIAYLLGLLKKYPKLQEVTVHFVMPHREEIEVHTFKREEFEGLYLRVCTVVARALAAQTSGSYDGCNAMAPCCLFCGDLGKCSKVAAVALKIGKKFSPITVPDNVTPSLMSQVENASQTMVCAQLMESWGKAIRAQITARTIEDDDWMPEGYVLRSRANREIADEKKIREVAKSNGISDEQFDGCKKLVMTPLNKLIRDQAGRGDKKAAEEAFRNSLLEKGGLTEDPPTIFLERLKT